MKNNQYSVVLSHLDLVVEFICAIYVNFALKGNWLACKTPAKLGIWLLPIARQSPRCLICGPALWPLSYAVTQAPGLEGPHTCLNALWTPSRSS